MLKRLRANNQIRSPEVMVIDDTGKPLGTMQTSKAIQLAHERDLDLVEVGPTAQPPIAKILDFGKYMYQLEKKEKQSAGKHKVQETKTVRVGYKTGEHDMDFKAKKADEFLGEGHNLKVELTLRGREKALAHLGKEKLLKFLDKLTEPYITQGTPMRSPYGWVIMISRDRKAKPKINKNNENPKITVQESKNNSPEKNTETPAGTESL